MHQIRGIFDHSIECQRDGGVTGIPRQPLHPGVITEAVNDLAKGIACVMSVLLQLSADARS